MSCKASGAACSGPKHGRERSKGMMMKCECCIKLDVTCTWEVRFSRQRAN